MSKNTSNNEVALCYPGEEQWELWSGDLKKGLSHNPAGKHVVAASPTEFRGVTHYAFPVTSVFCSPFWAASEDDSLLPDVVEMRLEANGTRPDDGAGRHYDYTIIDRDEARCLLQPILLADGKPIELPKGDSEYFDISPNYLPLPRNHLVIWRELGRWVAVATRKGQPVYFQALNSDEINEDASLELKCLLLQLHSQGVIEELSGIVVWTSALPEESRQLLENDLEMTVLFEDRPSPLLPEEPLDLLPSEVALNREAAARRQKIRNWVALAGLAYLLLIAFFGVQFYLMKRKVGKLDAAVKGLESEVGWIQPTADRWNSLSDAVSVERFPLELFYRVLEGLPERGVRLLDLDITGDRILVKGEATNRSIANRYVNQVKNNKTLQDYKWENPAFKMDKNGIVTFEVKGDYLYGTT